jgi:hypothetical protein
VKTSPPISHHRTVKHHAMSRALYDRASSVLWPCAGDVGWPKGTTVGQLVVLWPSRPLWPWAAVRPRGIVDFSIFL